MATKRTFGAGIWLLGQFVDRYTTDAYGPPVDTLAAIDRAGEVGELGAKHVKFRLGQDGHDYPFQADHAQIGDNAVSGVREIAEFAPQMQFAIEYKLKEPRVHITFSTASRTLLAIQEMGVNNVGIVLDFGHSLFAKETPADVLQLVHKHGKLVSVEVNDNWREWDDDLTVGSVHLTETLEFLLALRRINWDGPILLDQFPFRENPVAAARASIRTLQAMERTLDRLDLAQLKAAQDGAGRARGVAHNRADLSAPLPDARADGAFRRIPI